MSPEEFIVREPGPLIGPDEAVPMMNSLLGIPGDIQAIAYHFKLSSEEAATLFEDVKYVVMGGSSKRAFKFAQRAAHVLDLPIEGYSQNPGLRASIQSGDLSGYKRFIKSELGQKIGMPVEIGGTERYSLFKVGDLIVVNHGMGLGSIEIMLNELVIMLAAAEAKGVEMFRIGTSGGFGVDPGTVVITDRAWSEQPEEDLKVNGGYTPLVVCGQREYWPARTTDSLRSTLTDIAESRSIPHTVGGTIAKGSFYAGEARMDGIFHDHKHETAEAYFRSAMGLCIKNSEMEATWLTAIAGRLGLRHAVVCAVLDNCMTHQSIDFTPEQLGKFSKRAEDVVLHYLADRKGVALSNMEVPWARRLIHSLVR